MDDRELLELAAKAAGYIEFTWRSNIGPRARKANGVAGPWNPLADDGDALRLAATLEMDIFFNDGDTDVMNISEGGASPFERTRRAIVRAAAEIGKQSAA